MTILEEHTVGMEKRKAPKNIARGMIIVIDLIGMFEIFPRKGQTEMGVKKKNGKAGISMIDMKIKKDPTQPL